jgi:hypothetical protein
MLADGTWIFLLEALLALVLGVLIVWWTLPRKPKTRADTDADRGGRGKGPPAPPPQR